MFRFCDYNYEAWSKTALTRALINQALLCLFRSINNPSLYNCKISHELYILLIFSLSFQCGYLYLIIYRQNMAVYIHRTKKVYQFCYYLANTRKFD
jgi:hypothetical protein